MSDFILDSNQLNQFDILNEVFSAAEPRLSKVLTFDNLVNEAHVLNTIESSLARGSFMDLHLGLIFKKNGVSDYYKGMTQGKNYILEAARKVFPHDTKITESIESFREYLISVVNEDGLGLGNPTLAMAPGAIDTAINGGPLAPRKNQGKWDVLKKLWNAVTEGGSPIGILHFFIDIVGLFGDFFFPGVGVIADLINAGIYAIRGEWMLCSISLIAAVVIGFGDSLKLFKFAVRPAEKVMVELATEGGVKGAEKVLAKMPAAEKKGVITLLTKIFGSIGGALGKATSLLGKFFEGMGKITSWIPGLGLALKPIFEGFGKTLTKFGEKMALAGANFKLVTKGAKEAASISIDAAAKAGGDFVFDGPWIKVINKEGKQIGKYPASQIDKLTGKSLTELTAKKAGSAEAASILYKKGDDIAKVTKTLENPAVQASLRQRAFKFFESSPLLKGFTRMKKDLIFFIGKQIYKIIFGTDWVDGASNRWSKREVEGHGNGAMNDWINDRLRAQRDKTGAVYIPSLELDSQDQEVYDRVLDYQNHYAKLYGQPSIMQVVTKTYDKEGAGKEFKSFFDEIAAGRVTRGGKGDIVSHQYADQISSGISESLRSNKIIVKKISNFSDFKG